MKTKKNGNWGWLPLFAFMIACISYMSHGYKGAIWIPIVASGIVVFWNLFSNKERSQNQIIAITVFVVAVLSIPLIVLVVPVATLVNPEFIPTFVGLGIIVLVIEILLL